MLDHLQINNILNSDDNPDNNDQQSEKSLQYNIRSVVFTSTTDNTHEYVVKSWFNCENLNHLVVFDVYHINFTRYL